MKIAIEGQRLFRPKKHGMDFVALELVKNIQEIDHENEYVVFVREDQDVCLQSTDNVQIIVTPSGSYPWWEQVLLPRLVKEHQCDLLHCTSNTAPVKKLPVPLVITLHDIFFLETNAIFNKGYTAYQKFGNLYRQLEVPMAIKHASKLVTVSDSERNRILRFLGLTPDQVRTIHNGVSTFFKPVTDPAVLQDIRTKYGLPERYLFFFGNTDPKKNTKGVLIAYGKYLRETDDKIPLVIADYPQLALEKMLQEIHEESLLEHILRLDYIKNTDLPGIITMASLFLYPSFKESFGIPILEAMACGTPLITSNVLSMPEIAGYAAELVDPAAPYEITRAMHKILSDKELQETMRKNELIQATKFSWKKMATEYIALYKEILGIRESS